MGKEVAPILPYLASLLCWSRSAFFCICLKSWGSTLHKHEKLTRYMMLLCKPVCQSCQTELVWWTVWELQLPDRFFAQSTSALGFISKLEIAVQFPFFPFKGNTLWLGRLSQPLGTIWQLSVVFQQARALLQMFWKSERLILIYVKDHMCREGGFSISRCEICMCMEPSSTFMLTAMQRAPSTLNLDDTGVIQIKVIAINGWGMEYPDWAPHQGSNCKRTDQGLKIFWSLLQKKLYKMAYRALETQRQCNRFTNFN